MAANLHRRDGVPSLVRHRWLPLILGLAAGWLLLGAGALWAALSEPTIEARIDRHELAPGEELELTLILTIEGNLEEFQAQDIGVPEIPGLQKDPARTSSGSNLTILPSGQARMVYTVRSYYRATRPGEYELGPLELRYSEAGTAKVVRTPGPSVKVVDPAAPEPANPGMQAIQDEQDEGLRDIKEIEPAPFDFGLAFTIAAFALLLAAILLALAMRRRKPAPVPEELAPYIPPLGLLEKTLQQLDLIQMPPTCDDRQAVADYYLAITALAKEYLAERYGWRAPEQTSWELRQAYRTLLAERWSGEPDSFLGAFQDLFDLCDGGKYAHRHAAFPLMAQAKDQARRFFESDYRLPGGGLVPIGLQQTGAHVAPESALAGAAQGMRIRAVPASSQLPAAPSGPDKTVPRATRLADAALEAPSTSSTLFTQADSVELVARLTDRDSGPAAGPH